MGNAIYRDIVRMSLMVDARHAIIAVPIEYKYGKKATVSKAYEIGYDLFDAIWASDRLELPFEGLLLIGY